MQGITNAPQGGSSGEWTERIGTTDWSDLMIYENSSFKIQKDFMIRYNSNGMIVFQGVKGDIIPSTDLYAPYHMIQMYQNTSLNFQRFRIQSSNITSANIKLYEIRLNLTIDGANVTQSLSINSQSYSKTNFKIFVKE